MKHAGPEALAKLEDLLDDVRGLAGLRERSPGSFYRRSDAFLHFHEDPAGLFADLKGASGWERFPVDSRPERDRFLAAVTRALRGKMKRRCCSD